jgi:hypothetical protein
MPLRLGKKPFTGRRPRTKLFTLRYKMPVIAPPPVTRDWSGKVSDWTMMGNDQYGDCVCAGFGHALMVWSSQASTLFTPDEGAVMRLYRVFNPGSEDNGCDLQEVLTFLKTQYTTGSGFEGFSLADFAILNAASKQEAMDAINLFGCLYIGVGLPDSVVNVPNRAQAPWDTAGAVWTPNLNNGHCVLAVEYDDTGLTVITWGQRKRMSWDFYLACCEESYALDSPYWFEANGAAPNGFTSNDLTADLAGLPAVDPPPPENWDPIPGPSPQ